VDHDLLLTYEREGELEIPVQVERRLRRFNVTELLDGVDLPTMNRLLRGNAPEGEETARRLFGERKSHSKFKTSYALDAFITYSRKDAAFLDQLRAALVPHERVGELVLWCDPLIEPGQAWEREIVDQLEQAQIVILLLSNDFLRSSYCMDQ